MSRLIVVNTLLRWRFTIPAAGLDLNARRTELEKRSMYWGTRIGTAVVSVRSLTKPLKIRRCQDHSAEVDVTFRRPRYAYADRNILDNRASATVTYYLLRPGVPGLKTSFQSNASRNSKPNHPISEAFVSDLTLDKVILQGGYSHGETVLIAQLPIPPSLMSSICESCASERRGARHSDQSRLDAVGRCRRGVMMTGRIWTEEIRSLKPCPMASYGCRKTPCSD